MILPFQKLPITIKLKQYYRNFNEITPAFTIFNLFAKYKLNKLAYLEQQLND
jgi:hypothetical protein